MDSWSSLWCSTDWELTRGRNDHGADKCCRPSWKHEASFCCLRGIKLKTMTSKKQKTQNNPKPAREYYVHKLTPIKTVAIKMTCLYTCGEHAALSLIFSSELWSGRPQGGGRHIWRPGSRRQWSFRHMSRTESRQLQKYVFSLFVFKVCSCATPANN